MNVFLTKNINFVFLVHDTDGMMKMKYCGMTMPDQFTSSGRNITVVFHSDGSRNATGFKAIWFSSEVAISSPNFPENYSDGYDMVRFDMASRTGNVYRRSHLREMIEYHGV